MEEDYLDVIIKEIEEKEEEKTEAYFDLVLSKIKSLTLQIQKNFTQADKECVLINNWTQMRNNQLSQRIRFLEARLEGFIREKKEKTIELPNGTLKFHKRPDKVEIIDSELFLKTALPELLTIIPQSSVPNLNKIKAYIKTKPVPPGIIVLKGNEEFSYKLKGLENVAEKETEPGIQQAHSF